MPCFFIDKISNYWYVWIHHSFIHHPHYLPTFSSVLQVAEEAAVGERKASWIRTPLVSGSSLGGYSTLSFKLLTDYRHNSIIKLSVVRKVGEGFPDPVWPKTLKWAVVYCSVMFQRQVGPVSVYCDGVGCHVLWLWHGIPVWQHIGQSTTATSRPRRDMTSYVSKRR